MEDSTERSNSDWFVWVRYLENETVRERKLIKIEIKEKTLYEPPWMQQEDTQALNVKVLIFSSESPPLLLSLCDGTYNMI